MAEVPLSSFHQPFVGDTLKFFSSPTLWSKQVAKQGDIVRAEIRGIQGLKSTTVYHLSGSDGLKAFYNQENVVRGKIIGPSDHYLYRNSLDIVPKLNDQAFNVR